MVAAAVTSCHLVSVNRRIAVLNCGQMQPVVLRTADVTASVHSLPASKPRRWPHSHVLVQRAPGKTRSRVRGFIVNDKNLIKNSRVQTSRFLPEVVRACDVAIYLQVSVSSLQRGSKYKGTISKCFPQSNWRKLLFKVSERRFLLLNHN